MAASAKLGPSADADPFGVGVQCPAYERAARGGCPDTQQVSVGQGPAGFAR